MCYGETVVSRKNRTENVTIINQKIHYIENIVVECIESL